MRKYGKAAFVTAAGIAGKDCAVEAVVMKARANQSVNGAQEEEVKSSCYPWKWGRAKPVSADAADADRLTEKHLRGQTVVAVQTIKDLEFPLAEKNESEWLYEGAKCCLRRDEDRGGRRDPVACSGHPQDAGLGAATCD